MPIHIILFIIKTGQLLANLDRHGVVELDKIYLIIIYVQI